MCARLGSLESGSPRRFSRQWFVNGLRTGGWVGIITVLIWVYADIHFTKKASLAATLRIHTGSGEGLVLLSPGAVPLQLEVRGRRFAVDHFPGTKLSYDVSKGLLPGTPHEISTAELLRSLPEVRRAGVEILSVRPGTLSVHLDTFETVGGVKVQFDTTGGEAVDVKLAPERVDLQVPASRAQQLNIEKLEVRTETVDLSDKPAGEPITMDVHLRAPDIPGCRPRPTVVRVTFTVGQQVGRKEFTVSIGVKTPAEWFDEHIWSQYKLLRKDPLEWKPKIIVKGSKIDLEKLQAKDIEAYIVLTDDAKKKTDAWLPGPVHVRFPKGLNLEAEPVPQVNYRLEKLSGAGGP